VLTEIIGPHRVEVGGQFRILHDDKFCDLYGSHGAVRESNHMSYNGLD